MPREALGVPSEEVDAPDGCGRMRRSPPAEDAGPAVLAMAVPSPASVDAGVEAGVEAGVDVD